MHVEVDRAREQPVDLCGGQRATGRVPLVGVGRVAVEAEHDRAIVAGEAVVQVRSRRGEAARDDVACHGPACEIHGDRAGRAAGRARRGILLAARKRQREWQGIAHRHGRRGRSAAVVGRIARDDGDRVRAVGDGARVPRDLEGRGAAAADRGAVDEEIHAGDSNVVGRVCAQRDGAACDRRGRRETHRRRLPVPVVAAATQQCETGEDGQRRAYSCGSVGVRAHGAILLGGAPLARHFGSAPETASLFVFAELSAARAPHQPRLRRCCGEYNCLG